MLVHVHVHICVFDRAWAGIYSHTGRYRYTSGFIITLVRTHTSVHLCYRSVEEVWVPSASLLPAFLSSGVDKAKLQVRALVLAWIFALIQVLHTRC